MLESSIRSSRTVLGVKRAFGIILALVLAIAGITVVNATSAAADERRPVEECKPTDYFNPFGYPTAGGVDTSDVTSILGPIERFLVCELEAVVLESVCDNPSEPGSSLLCRLSRPTHAATIFLIGRHARQFLADGLPGDLYVLPSLYSWPLGQ